MIYDIYFSPTGGTKTVSDTLAHSLGMNVKYIDLIKPVEEVEIYDDAICVISVPSYGGRVPSVAAERLSRIKAYGAKAVLVAVYGNRAADDTLAELSDIVERCGFVVVAGVEAVAEHSLAPVYAEGRPDDKDRQELKEFAVAIEQALEKESFGVSLPGTRPYREFKASPMKLYFDGKCIDCKKCARSCPVGAISMQNVTRVDSAKCFSCMHCTYVCPMGVRHNDPEVTRAITERLKGRADGRKENKLYL